MALQMALQTERFTVQTPNSVLEDNSQNALGTEAV